MAYQTRKDQPKCAVFWVPAVSQAGFEQAYREIGLLLHIPGLADAKADVKQLVKAKLSDEGLGHWLMIVDNADDVNLLLGAPNQESTVDQLIDYIPHSGKGSVVFTTRTAKAASELAQSNVIELGELGNAEARELLRTRLFPKHQHQVEDEATVSEFLGMLAFLALAIVQAAAFINQNDYQLSDYVQLYRSNEQQATQLLSQEFQDQGRYRETINPVATTWYISFEHIRDRDQLAADYLSFMACTANNDIPESMLPTEGSPVAQIKAIGTLKAYAFITEQEAARDRQQVRQELEQQEQTQRPAKVFDVHPLVYLSMRGWLKAHDHWLDQAKKTMMRLEQVMSWRDHSTMKVWTAYLPHARHVVGVPEMHDAEARMWLLDRLGWCELTLGQYKAAEGTYRQLIDSETKVLGKEHPSMLTSMSNLATALSSQGQYVEAEQMHRETLALREKVLGKEHPNTLVSINNTAVALGNLGRYAEAEQMHRETLALREKVLGKEHPDTLSSMNNLADALSKQRQYAEAEQIHRETLALKEKVLGKEHPDMLSSMNNAAVALSKQGQYAEAEQMHRETLALRENVLGKEHPDTLSSMNNVAVTLSNQGRYAEAEELFEKAIKGHTERLGPNHPHTIVFRDNLAAMRAMAQRARLLERESLSPANTKGCLVLRPKKEEAYMRVTSITSIEHKL
jgi:tetratricopeptide (TPR) repeat protein